MKLIHTVSIFAGVIYDVIVEPPSVGSTTDENGHQKPVSKNNGWIWLSGLLEKINGEIIQKSHTSRDPCNHACSFRTSPALLFLITISLVAILDLHVQCSILTQTPWQPITWGIFEMNKETDPARPGFDPGTPLTPAPCVQGRHATPLCHSQLSTYSW